MRILKGKSLFTTVIQNWIWFCISFLVIFTIFMVFNGYEITQDTGSYENHWVTRHPFYPLILDFFKGKYGILVFFQTLLGVVSIFYIIWILSRLFILNRLMVVILYAVLFLPFLPSWLRIGNLIATEALSYTLFLTSVGLFISGLSERKSHHFIASFFVLSMLLLVRKQFLFVYPVYFILILLGREKLKVLILLAALTVSFFLAVAGERLYHGIYHGRYEGTPFTGMQLIAMPLYTMPAASDVEFSEREQRIFDTVQNRLRQEYLSMESCEKAGLPIECGYYHYRASYNSIIWESLRPALTAAGVTDWFEIDALTTSIALKLIKRNLIVNVKFYLSALHNGVGTYYLLFLLIVLSWSMVRSFQLRDSISQTIMLITALNLANIFLVLLVEPLLHRYLFYTSLLQVTGLVALISSKESH